MKPEKDEQPKRSKFLELVAESGETGPWDKRSAAEKLESWKQSNAQTRQMLERSESGRKYIRDRGL